MSSTLKPEVRLPQVELLEADGEPLESAWHRAAIALLIEIVAWLFRDRSDYYVGGNMFIYYSEEQARTRRHRCPAFFYVDGVGRLPERQYWVVWREGGRYPDLIVELLSPETGREDCTTKKSLYERTFRTFEYFCYDPRTQKLEGWRLGERQRYRPSSRIRTAGCGARSWGYGLARGKGATLASRRYGCAFTMPMAD